MNTSKTKSHDINDGVLSFSSASEMEWEIAPGFLQSHVMGQQVLGPTKHKKPPVVDLLSLRSLQQRMHRRRGRENNPLGDHRQNLRWRPIGGGCTRRVDVVLWRRRLSNLQPLGPRHLQTTQCLIGPLSEAKHVCFLSGDSGRPPKITRCLFSLRILIVVVETN